MAVAKVGFTDLYYVAWDKLTERFPPIMRGNQGGLWSKAQMDVEGYLFSSLDIREDDKRRIKQAFEESDGNVVIWRVD